MGGNEVEQIIRYLIGTEQLSSNFVSDTYRNTYNFHKCLVELGLIITLGGEGRIRFKVILCYIVEARVGYMRHYLNPSPQKASAD